MVTIAITPTAFAAIEATLPKGAPGQQRRLSCHVAAPGGSYRDVILRLGARL
jgi:hypothetical protein